MDELYSISQQLVQSEEEMRLLRADIKQKTDEISQLHIELEEAYIELDSLGKCAWGIGDGGWGGRRVRARVIM
jgi:hypothetical protein